MVTFFCKQVEEGQVFPIAAEVQAIIDIPALQAHHKLCCLLGIAGFYRAFCKIFSDVVALLTSLASPETPFQWSERCQFAFEAIKALLCSAPVLSAPNFACPFKLEVDTSAFSVGTVLLQEDECCIYHPVSYFSKQFNRHQLHCSAIKKRGLGFTVGLATFRSAPWVELCASCHLHRSLLRTSILVFVLRRVRIMSWLVLCRLL